MAKNTKACRRPSLFVSEFLVSATLLAFAYVSYQNSLAGQVWAQAASTTSAKPTASRGKGRGRNWHIFKSPDGDFTLAFPEETKPQNVTQGPVTVIRGFGVTTSDGTNFSVNFHDIGGDPKARENNEWNSNLEETLSAFDRSQNVQVVQTHRLAKNTIESELWQTLPNNAGKINYLRRSIIRRSRVYTLGCGPVIDGKVVNKPLCQRFFDSMRFIANTNLNRTDRRRVK